MSFSSPKKQERWRKKPRKNKPAKITEPATQPYPSHIDSNLSVHQLGMQQFHTAIKGLQASGSSSPKEMELANQKSLTWLLAFLFFGALSVTAAITLYILLFTDHKACIGSISRYSYSSGKLCSTWDQPIDRIISMLQPIVFALIGFIGVVYCVKCWLRPPKT
ncbi:hypothetical protein [Vogesella indigofera]|uniref:hypothetical protein n=1 Tax=Vogesella indigofera TaxID=45465 RepID=UPI00234E93E2|nr:hypothetical protein [Vogesella indigofera]MDC7698029.1 hypothetical protein [Vogesella indigofera]